MHKLSDADISECVVMEERNAGTVKVLRAEDN